MKIDEITGYSPEILDKINKFLDLLVGVGYHLTKQQVEMIISEKNSHLFFAANEDGIWMGMVTVGIYSSPTGKKAWIEDVVVDEKFRGEGVGKSLTNFAIQFAKDQHADVVMLTSRPERLTANNLYQRLGFEQKKTNVYRFLLK